MSVTGDFAGGIRLGSHIVPTGTADTYPVTKPTFGLGGLRTVGTTADRDAIPSQRREEGMIVYVSELNYYYGLCGGIDNDDWNLLSFGGTGGGGQGAKGNQGKTGPQGSTGPQGDRGPQGWQGTTGPQGRQGTTGPQGYQGSQGRQGNTGYQGDFGPQGRQGIIGPRGTGGSGGTGPQGPQGTTGYQGVQGRAGVTGFAIAPAGPQGNQGFQGEIGFQGPSGPSGERGSGKYTIGQNEPANSSTGDKWFNTLIGLELTFLGLCGGWVATNAVIASGRTGAQGPVGSGGSGDTGSQGPQGTTGYQGVQGRQGPSGGTGYQGVQGRQGPSGGTGHQGIVGPQGRQGNTGTRGPQGLSGPTGPQGHQGYTGPSGVQGPIGVTGFAIAPAGPQGNQGHQGNIGPQGLSGPTGVQGPQGTTGYQGVQGSQGRQGVTGPQGNQGITGPQGNQGPQGLGIKFTASSVQPTPASAGDIWYDITTGIHFIFNYDGDSYQWVQLDGVVGNQGPEGPAGEAADKGDTGSQGPTGPQGHTGNTGDGLFDTTYESGTTLNHSLNFDDINTVSGDGRKFPVLLGDGSITFDYIRAQDIFLDSEFVFGINSFTVSGSSTALIGSGNYSLTGRQLTVDYQEPGSITVVNADVTTNASSDSGFPVDVTSGNAFLSGRNISYPASKNTSITFTVGATGSDSSFVTKTDSITFRNNNYSGVTNAASLTGGELNSELSGGLDNNRSQTFTVSAGAGEYIYYAYPSSYGDATFTVGGFAGGFSKLHGGATAHVNIDGFSETYFIYRSDNASLGSTTVVVS